MPSKGPKRWRDEPRGRSVLALITLVAAPRCPRFTCTRRSGGVRSFERHLAVERKLQAGELDFARIGDVHDHAAAELLVLQVVSTDLMCGSDAALREGGQLRFAA